MPTEHILGLEMSFAENLKRLRRDKGWTQAQLAEHAGLKAAHMPRLEKDTADPKLSTIYSLISAFGCTSDGLLMDSEKVGIDGILKATIERAMMLPDLNKKILIEVIDKYCIATGLESSFNPDNKTWVRVWNESPDTALRESDKQELQNS